MRRWLLIIHAPLARQVEGSRKHDEEMKAMSCWAGGCNEEMVDYHWLFKKGNAGGGEGKVLLPANATHGCRSLLPQVRMRAQRACSHCNGLRSFDSHPSHLPPQVYHLRFILTRRRAQKTKAISTRKAPVVAYLSQMISRPAYQITLVSTCCLKH